MCQVYVVPLKSSQPRLDELFSRLGEMDRTRVLAKKQPGPRRQSLSAWLLVRVLACEGLGVENPALSFGLGGEGKPCLPGREAFQFSLSHTQGAVAVGVSGSPVGVDVERIRPINSQLARRFFTQAEQEYLAQGDAQARFFEVWTRKEACVKYAGASLGKELASLEVLSGQWAQRTTLFRQGELLTACCCQGPPPRFVVLPEEELLARARALLPYPDRG